MNLTATNSLIVGVGSALIDLLAHEDEDFLEKSGFLKGGMTLVDIAVIEKTLSQLKSKPQMVPGGSACNTVMGVARLGVSARFIGKIGNDKLSDFFESDLIKNNVQPFLFKSSLPTGRVLTIITPDAQRSMFTYLGASAETRPEEITGRCFDKAEIVHIEGYLVFNQNLILAALKTAKEMGASVSLDLASFTVVEASKNFLESIVRDYVDILIANEDEAFAFTGHTDEKKALETLSKKADIAVLKVGKRGSYISHNGDFIKIEPKGSGDALDTTGAGDLWAAGFLYGLINKYPLDKCGALGSICGYEVCQVVGANIPDEGWVRIKNSME